MEEVVLTNYRTVVHTVLYLGNYGLFLDIFERESECGAPSPSPSHPFDLRSTVRSISVQIRIQAKPQLALRSGDDHPFPSIPVFSVPYSASLAARLIQVHQYVDCWIRDSRSEVVNYWSAAFWKTGSWVGEGS